LNGYGRTAVRRMPSATSALGTTFIGDGIFTTCEATSTPGFESERTDR
jgi:hypothetical protein